MAPSTPSPARRTRCATSATPAPLIAAGGVAEVEHLVRLAALGVEGAIVGRALYDGRVDLREALAAVQEATS